MQILKSFRTVTNLCMQLNEGLKCEARVRGWSIFGAINKLLGNATPRIPRIQFFSTVEAAHSLSWYKSILPILPIDIPVLYSWFGSVLQYRKMIIVFCGFPTLLLYYIYSSKENLCQWINETQIRSVLFRTLACLLERQFGHKKTKKKEKKKEKVIRANITTKEESRSCYGCAIR